MANSTEDAADFHFDYRQPFQYRWTQHALLSSVVELLGEIYQRLLDSRTQDNRDSIGRSSLSEVSQASAWREPLPDRWAGCEDRPTA